MKGNLWKREKDRTFKSYLKRVYKILDDNLGKADAFVLVAPFDRRRNREGFRSDEKEIKEEFYEDPYDDKYPYGRDRLKKEDGVRALVRAEEFYKKQLRELYSEMAGLPPFDFLYDEIKSECLEYYEKRREGALFDSSPYISDLVYDGKVK